MNNIESQQMLLLKEQDLRVENTEIEGSTQISAIEAIKLMKRRIALGVLLSIVTAFIFTLACSWSQKLVRRFFFKRSHLDIASHIYVQNNDLTCNIVRLRRKDGGIYFINRKLKYFYQSAMNQFKALEFELGIKRELLKSGGNTQFQKYQDLYGKCLIEVPKPNLFFYLAKELTGPFYILQYMSCILWIQEGLPLLAIVMITVSLIFLTINFLLLYSSTVKLRQLAQTNVDVLVYRKPEPFNTNQHLPFQKISSEQLVPGDLIMIENKMRIPCDCVLIQGDLLINEASLTGESIPIPKVPIEDIAEKPNFDKDKRHCLYEGTKVLSSKSDSGYCLAIVGRTGFSSFKGQIFRSVLYPKQQSFGFYRQGIKSLIFLAIAVVGLYFCLLPRLISINFTPTLLTYRFLDALTWIVPPALPIFVSMCQTYSLVRLRKKKVFGIDPLKALMAGKIDTICFDKTGTLTTIGIDFYGYVKVENNKELSPLILSHQIHEKTGLEFKIFSTCHGCYLIDGEMMGDSLDVELFKFTNFELFQNVQGMKFQVSNNQTVLNVLKVYEFESALQRMSVIVQEKDEFYVFLKGSPEKVQELSIQNTIPSQLKSVLDSLTLKGLRILGFGYRKLSQEEAKTLLNGSRALCEKDINFLGLLAMENKLKPDTPQVIEELRKSGLDLKIISGDNPLTTVQCAKECSIILDKPVFLVDFDMKSGYLTLDEIRGDQEFSTLEESENRNHEDVMDKLIEHLMKNKHSLYNTQIMNEAVSHSFALTGKAFDYFWAQLPKEEYYTKKHDFAGFDGPLKQVRELHLKEMSEEELHHKLFAALVTNASVFARMRPEQKSSVVEQLQQLNRKVMMIGDGANDCAAIKQADVGVSFAQSDASYSAPYSSQSDSIDCVKKILLDGRAALQNTCEVFHFYVGASVFKYVSAMILMAFGQNFNNIQYIFINYIGTVPYLKAISLSGPTRKLSKCLPQDDMVDKSNAIQLSYQVIICSLGVMCNYLCWNRYESKEGLKYSNTRRNDFIMNDDDLHLQSTLFMSLLFYYQFACIAFYTSKPFKHQIYKHKVLLPVLVVLQVIIFLLYFAYGDWQMSMLGLAGQNSGYQLQQFGITCGFGMLMLFGSELVIKKFVPANQPILKKRQKKSKVH